MLNWRANVSVDSISSIGAITKRSGFFMIKQRTLTNVITGTGVGLHTGVKICLTLHPARANTGIIFRRVDIEPVVEIPATVENVSSTRLSTTLECNNVQVSTVEHLMSAFAGLGIDNAYVDVTAGEVPIMDGSAHPFLFLMESAGITLQNAPKKFMRVKKKIVVRESDKWAKFEPYNGFRVSFKIDFDHPVLKNSNQNVSIDFANESYKNNISRARTFGFMSDLERLQEAGLAQGASDKNAIVMNQFHILNDDQLRFQDEFVRHKILDAIGDIYLLGYPLIGSFSAYKSGHFLNNRLLATLKQDQSAWELIESDDFERVPTTIIRPLVAENYG